MQLTKKIAKELIDGDFIPNDERVDIRELTFRRTQEHEVFRCCRSTGCDPQSGPLYCGDIAEFIALVKIKGSVMVVSLCERHRPPKNLIKESDR